MHMPSKCLHASSSASSCLSNERSSAAGEGDLTCHMNNDRYHDIKNCANIIKLGACVIIIFIFVNKLRIEILKSSCNVRYCSGCNSKIIMTDKQTDR